MSIYGDTKLRDSIVVRNSYLAIVGTTVEFVNTNENFGWRWVGTLGFADGVDCGTPEDLERSL